MVDWTIRFATDRDGVRTEEAVARKEDVKKTFTQIQENYTPDTPTADLSENERSLLGMIVRHRSIWKMCMNPTVEALEKKLQLEFIAEVKKEIRENPREHYIEGYKMYRLFLLGDHLNQNIRSMASGLRKSINQSKSKYGNKRKTMDNYMGSRKKR